MKSIFVLNDNELNISNIEYISDDNLLSIECDNPICIFNIDFIKELNKYDYNKRIDISNDIYLDQCIKIDSLSFVIGIDNIYLTRVSQNQFFLEIDLPDVDVLIPPYDYKLKSRIDLKDCKLKIENLHVEVYFNV